MGLLHNSEAGVAEIRAEIRDDATRLGFADEGRDEYSRYVPRPHAVDRRTHPGELIVETLHSLPQLLALECEWRTLELRMPSHPFLSFDWNVTWWHHLRQRKFGVKDTLAVKTFRSTEGELCAIAPMMLTSRPGVGPLSLRQLHFFGADPNMTELRGVVSTDDLRQSVYCALLGHLRIEKSSWDWVDLAGLPSTTEAVRMVESHFPDTGWLQDVPDYFLPLPQTWAELKQRLPRNIKESLRKCYNAPRRDGIVPSLVVVREPVDVGQAIERFLHLHKARSEFAGAIPHRNVFATAHTRLFLRDACRKFASRDALRIFQLVIAGEIVATRIAFVLGDSLYLYYSGYEPAYAKYSVMTTLLTEAIRYAIGEGLRFVNLSTGKDISKDRWKPEHVLFRNAVIVSPSVRGRLAHRGATTIRRAFECLPASAQLRALLARSS